MLMLKLQRVGKKHQAGFRLVVGEKRTKLNGKQLEQLGWFNPHENKKEFNQERILYWMKQGAKPSDTVMNLLITAGILSGKKIAVHKQPKKTASAGVPAVASATATVTAGKIAEPAQSTPEAKPAA